MDDKDIKESSRMLLVYYSIRIEEELPSCNGTFCIEYNKMSYPYGIHGCIASLLEILKQETSWYANIFR